MVAGGKLLVLGGGGFLSYHVAEAGLRAGLAVSVLSRSGSAPLDGVEVLTGDRRDDLEFLHGRTWDAVVDTFTDDEPGAPAISRAVEALTGSVGCYCYVSGMSVYAPDGPAVPTETAPVRATGQQPDDDPLQARSLAKLAGENAVGNGFDGPVLIPRVGIMVGPRDPSQRFTWWPYRFLRALRGDAPPVVLGPGQAGRPVQYSDARDIAQWMVRSATEGLGGTYNTVGPLRYESLTDVLDACRAAAERHLDDTGATRGEAAAALCWVEDEDRLRAALADVEEEHRPLWFPEDQIPQQAIDSRAAFTAGLRFRPAAGTALDTLRWALDDGRPPLPDFVEPRT